MTKRSLKASNCCYLVQLTVEKKISSLNGINATSIQFPFKLHLTFPKIIY